MKKKFLVCVYNKDNDESLEVMKIYQNIPDKKAEQHKMLRIIDESGEDYLYPANYFAPIIIPEQTRNQIIRHLGI